MQNIKVDRVSPNCKRKLNIKNLINENPIIFEMASNWQNNQTSRVSGRQNHKFPDCDKIRHLKNRCHPHKSSFLVRLFFFCSPSQNWHSTNLPLAVTRKNPANALIRLFTSCCQGRWNDLRYVANLMVCELVESETQLCAHSRISL